MAGTRRTRADLSWIATFATLGVVPYVVYLTMGGPRYMASRGRMPARGTPPALQEKGRVG